MRAAPQTEPLRRSFIQLEGLENSFWEQKPHFGGQPNSQTWRSMKLSQSCGGQSCPPCPVVLKAVFIPTWSQFAPNRPVFAPVPLQAPSCPARREGPRYSKEKPGWEKEKKTASVERCHLPTCPRVPSLGRVWEPGGAAQLGGVPWYPAPPILLGVGGLGSEASRGGWMCSSWLRF